MTARLTLDGAQAQMLLESVEGPAYVYDLGLVRSRYLTLQEALGPDVAMRYAVKANPHPRVLEALIGQGARIDASSIGEIRRALEAGAAPEVISFTGPGKRDAEIAEAVAQGVGLIIIESEHQAEMTMRASEEAERLQPVLLRVNPSHTPKGFSARMTGAGSQFGVDEDQAVRILNLLRRASSIRLDGLHVYNGSNCLDPVAIAENLRGLVAMTALLAGEAPFLRVIYGAGLGLPYHQGETSLPLEETVSGIRAALSGLPEATAVDLELGRWLVGPAGVLLTRVLDRKQSGGRAICICDAGFNAHLAACGMMGSVLRRPWPITNLSGEDQREETVTLTGPLCTSIDILARDIEMPSPQVGDILEVALSGAYGPTASPAGFISHPPPVECILEAP